MNPESSTATIDWFPIEAGHIHVFAGAISDDVPPDGLTPPTFVIAGAHVDPNYPLRPRPGRPWIASSTLAEDSLTGSTLHDDYRNVEVLTDNQHGRTVLRGQATVAPNVNAAQARP